MKTIKFFLLFLALKLVFVCASPIGNINDSFNSTLLNTTLWQTSYNGSFSSYSVDGSKFVMTGSGCGGREIKTNYYFIGDFDAQIDGYRQSGSAHYITFRFFKEGETHSSATHGTTWGLAGSIYSWFPHTTEWWCYSAPGATDYTVVNQWVQFRIQRTGNDVYTYHRLLGEQNWVLQNTYTNFGSSGVFLNLIAGDGSSSGSTLAYADNFIATGYTDTNYLAIATVPEPVSFFLLSFGLCILVFAKK